MTRTQIERIPFHNVAYGQESDMIVSSLESGISLFLAEYGKKGGIGGDCEVALLSERAHLLSRTLEKALSSSPRGDWLEIGRVSADWSDQTEEGRLPEIVISTGKDHIELVIRTEPSGEAPPYRAVMDMRTAKRLLSALILALR